ncbi:MAG: type III secretion system translocon subunit SctB [Candidatus Competibacteraceae bacterium]|nr:type III secretion system translocon subunit SctB [Candidatus Competibacteraceae bacterium]
MALNPTNGNAQNTTILSQDRLDYLNQHLITKGKTQAAFNDTLFQIDALNQQDSGAPQTLAPKLQQPSQQVSDQQIQQTSATISSLTQGDSLVDLYSIAAFMYKQAQKMRDLGIKIRDAQTNAQVTKLHDAADKDRDSADSQEINQIILGSVGLCSGLLSGIGAGFSAAQTSEVSSLEIEEPPPPEIQQNLNEPNASSPPPSEAEPQVNENGPNQPPPRPNNENNNEMNAAEEDVNHALEVVNKNVEQHGPQADNDPNADNAPQQPRSRSMANADENPPPPEELQENDPDSPTFRKKAAGILKKTLTGPGKGEATDASRQITLQSWSALGKILESGGQIAGAHWAHKAGYEKADAADDQADATKSGADRDAFNSFINNMNSLMSDTQNIMSQASSNKLATTRKIWS